MVSSLTHDRTARALGQNRVPLWTFMNCPKTADPDEAEASDPEADLKRERDER